MSMKLFRITFDTTFGEVKVPLQFSVHCVAKSAELAICKARKFADENQAWTDTNGNEHYGNRHSVEVARVEILARVDCT